MVTGMHRNPPRKPTDPTKVPISLQWEDRAAGLIKFLKKGISCGMCMF